MSNISRAWGGGRGGLDVNKGKDERRCCEGNVQNMEGVMWEVLI